ncbi:MAG TPA: GWxTD domain-containing protein [Vicinamibacteria bacterium]|jgi:GWxTD domain-containing protein
MFVVKSIRAAILGIAFVVTSSAVVMSQDKLSNDDQEWLEEEVAALITAEEVEIFQSLQSRDRNLFKELFWSRRDFNPMTPDNEFLQWYEERVKAADEAIEEGGARSDMGQVFILFGPPAEANPRDESMVWTYPANPSLGIPDGFSFQFRQSGMGFRLIRGDEVEAALETAKAFYLANRAISYTRDAEGRLLKPDSQSDPNSPAKKVLQELMTNKTENPAVPFDARTSFFRATEGAVYVPILFEIDADALTWDGNETEVTVFGAVENAEGQSLYPFEQPVTLAKNDAGLVVYDVPIQVTPGLYTFCFGVMDQETSKVGTRVLEVEVPNLSTQGVKLSSVLVYSGIQETTEGAGVPGHAFQFGTNQFIPKTGDVPAFTQKDNLGLFFFVYGYGLNASGQPNVTTQFVFQHNGSPKGQTPVQPVQTGPDQGIGYLEIPLESFEPGNYKVQVKVVDQVAQQTVTQDVEFVLQ